MHAPLAGDDHLDRIRSITDATLAHLDADELLDALVERARELLGADTAAVLLLDDDHQFLVATAAQGIEEEVRQGVRIPVGRGFAGRIAAERRPVILDRVDHTTVMNPILSQRGIKSLLGVPLMSAGEVTGVLHVGTLSPRRFTDDDVELLQVVGDRIATTTQTQRTKGHRLATSALQASLVPSRLPQLTDLEFAARYVPGGAEGVGGDWYDVFTLPSGWLCVVMGDVAGRGLRAAVVMGRLRSTVRAYALTESDPATILTLVDRKLSYFEPSEMATVLLAAFDPTHSYVQLSSAGHPPPVIAPLGGPATFAHIEPDAPVGLGLGGQRRVTTIDLPAGAVMCFYTDGLVERRRVPLDDRFDLLLSAVSAEDPEAVCASVMGRLVGAEVTPDDIALLVARRSAETAGNVLDLEVPAEPSSLAIIRAALRRWLASIDASDTDRIDLLLAVGEASSNAVEHAYGAAAGTVTVHVELQGDDVVAEIADHGAWRSPRGEGHGRGTAIMSEASDELRVDRRDEGTAVLIRKRLER